MSIANQDISFMRTPYKSDDKAFLESQLPTCDPFQLFKIWLEEAVNCKEIKEPNAFCVSTSTKSGIPSSRMVLLKYYGPDGFKFFTNSESRKGKELKENPKAAFLFYWDPLSRQVRIEGNIEELEENEVNRYFHSRPKISQLSAVISNQSEPISDREELVERFKELKSKFEQEDVVPKPHTWKGYKLIPKSFEFWQGQTSRLHDRLVFRLKDDIENKVDEKFRKEAINGWYLFRLQP